MNSARWQTVKSVFLEAVDLPGAEQDAFLTKLAAADREISDQVRLLLATPGDQGPDLKRACWAPAESQPAGRTFEPGHKLDDRFEITGLLGTGGLGEVYRAYDHHQKAFVAIKTLKPALARDLGAAARLRRELHSALLVTHPNVCRVFDIHLPRSVGDYTFFTMELLEGETLSSYLHRNGPMPEQTAVGLASQILDGLQAIHERGIIHRDLKANNIMLVDAGTRAILMDFGLAREMSAAGDLPTTLESSPFAGTPAYMAPEQLRGEAASIPSDIHALGVVLFEITTGRRPFEGETPLVSAAKRLHEAAPAPKQFAPRISRSWNLAILRCLDSDSSKRPQSVDEVRRLLSAAAPPFLQTRRMFSLGALTMAAAGAAAFVMSRQPSPHPVQLGVSDFDNLTGDPALDYLTRGATSELVRRLTGLPGIDVIRLYRASPRSGRGLELHAQLAKAGPDLEWRLHLKNAQSGRIIWQKAYGQKTGQSVLSLESYIADDLRLQLARFQGTVQRHVTPPSPTGEASAFDQYMRARFLLENPSPAASRTALPFLERAVASDPGFALAWSALADANLALMNYDPDNSNSLYRRALESATRAVDIDPNLAEGHASLAAVRQQAMDWTGAEQSYHQALRLKPFFPRAHRWYAGFVLQFGRIEETLEHCHIALKQDPYDQIAPMTIGLFFAMCGQVDEAISLMEPAVAGRDMETTRHNLGFAYATMAQAAHGAARQEWLRKALAEARMVEAIEQRQKKERPLLSDLMYPIYYAIGGQRAELERYIARLREDVEAGRRSAENLAVVLAVAGDTAASLDVLERGFGESPASLLYIKVNPFYQSLRSEPRFTRLIHDLRL